MDNLNIKKIIGLIVGVVIVSVGLTVTFKYFNTTSVTIAAPPEAIVELRQLSTNGTYKTKTLGQGNVTRRISKGTYTVTASKGDQSTAAPLTITSREPIALTLELRSLQDFTEIIGQTAYSPVAASNGRVRFFNPDSNLINEHVKQGVIPDEIFFEAFPLTSIIWQSFNSAIYQHASGEFGVINNGVVGRFPYPNNTKPDGDYVPEVSSVAFSKSGELYAVIEGALYKYSSQLTKGVKILNLPSNNYLLAIGGDSILIYFDIGSESHDDTSSSNFLIRNGEDVTEFDLSETRISSASINPSGTKLGYQEDGQLKVYDFTTKSSEVVYNETPDNPTSTDWLDDSAIIILDNGSLWSIDSTSKRIYKLTNVSGLTTHPKALTIDRKNKAIYISTTPKTNFDHGILLKADY